MVFDRQDHFYPVDPVQSISRGHLLVSSVPMHEQKHDDKGLFFQAGQCAVLLSFRERKWYFCQKRGPGMFFTSLEHAVKKGAEIKSVPKDLVVTELQKQLNYSSFPMYTVLVQHTKAGEVRELAL